MNKKIFIAVIALLMLIFTLQVKTYAASIPLNSVAVETDKEKVAPGEEIKLTINFGTTLGAYTFDIAYDNSIFEYVSTDGGTENDDGTKVRVTFYDSTGGTNPRTEMSITFKAKDDLEATSQTNFSITAEGLANEDASQEYDDITTAIEKEVTVEPNYEDYELSLEYSGNIIIDEEKELKLITKSSMGRNYDNLMLTAEVTEKPEDANVTITAIDDQETEVDILQDGWGSTTGYSLGGKDVEQELLMTSTFDKVGEYKIKFSVLDKDNSNQVVVEEEFTLSVLEEEVILEEEENNSENAIDENITTEENDTNSENETEETTEDENAMPTELPKTGTTKYSYIAVVMALLVSGYVVTKNYKKES